MSQFRSAEFLTAVSDIHVLVFMATLDIMPLRYVASSFRKMLDVIFVFVGTFLDLYTRQSGLQMWKLPESGAILTIGARCRRSSRPPP